MSRTSTISWCVSEPMGDDQRGKILGLGDDDSSYISATRRGVSHQAFAIGVLAYALQQQAGGLLDLGLVDHRAGPSLRGMAREGHR